MTTDPEIINSLVARIFRIEDLTSGGHSDPYLLRYRGQLLAGIDSAAAYDQLAEALKPHHLMPLFRDGESEAQTIFLVEKLPAPPPSNPRTNLIMFILTVLSVMFVGAQIPEGVPIPEDALGALAVMARYFYTGWPFALALLSILLAHEFGHYFAGRHHKTDVSLPFFIPLPFSILGTMGAFINMRELPKNKRTLFDIGIAGPLAGLIVSIPVLLIGLGLSTTGIIQPSEGGFIEGNSILYLLAKFVIFGKLLPAPVDFNGLPPVLYWLAYFFSGRPVPFGGLDVMIHPVALAGWAGVLVTALNLIPAGQFDGGHILYALFGRKVRKALPFIMVALIGLGLFWSGWWLWAALIFFMGRSHPETLDEITTLDPGRRRLAWLMIVIFVLVFTPVPLIGM
ncbi:MAG: site-2 protease family protein [Anaerolineales bacterium]|jgi:membrane-associated protease RseP (regulator of RpoE activity)|nr:site-2 protease family protein [Anaerolineales bacterium]